MKLRPLLQAEVERLEAENKRLDQEMRLEREYHSNARRQLMEQIEHLKKEAGHPFKPEDAVWHPTGERRVAAEINTFERMYERNVFGVVKDVHTITVPKIVWEERWMMTWGVFEWRRVGGEP